MARRILHSFSKAFTKPVVAEAVDDAETATHPTPDLYLWYAPLPESPSTIRLLHLHAGSWKDDIGCSLQEYRLEEAQDHYVSISYTWGRVDVDRPVSIRCNGKPIFVSSNLFTVLRRLRQLDRVVKIWADALCINQADSAERTQQVGLMADIYSRSRETVIWLGEPAENEDIGARFKDADNRPRLNLSTREATPQIAWAGDESDEILRDAYLQDPASSFSVNAKIPPDIFGAFCLIHELANGVSYANLKTLDRPWIQEQYVAPFGLQKAPAVWAGLARLMSRACVRRLRKSLCIPS